MFKYLDDFLQKKNIGQVIVSILFIIYLLIGYTMPYSIATFISSIAGIIIVCLFVLFLFIKCNPILAIISLFVAFKLINNSCSQYSTNTGVGLSSLAQYGPKETTFPSSLNPTHQFEYTLEQEMVAKMAPICDTNYTLTTPSYKPNVENTYDSEIINKNS